MKTIGFKPNDWEDLLADCLKMELDEDQKSVSIKIDSDKLANVARIIAAEAIQEYTTGKDDGSA